MKLAGPTKALVACLSASHPGNDAHYSRDTRDASSIANIKRRCKIEEVRSKSLHAECGPRPSWTGIEIKPRTCLPIKVRMCGSFGLDPVRELLFDAQVAGS